MTEETPDKAPVEEQAAEKAEEKPLEQPHFDPEADKKPTEEVKSVEKPEEKKEEVKPDEKSAEQKKAEENPEYMGNEMGEDILSIPLDDPVANAAASKIQKLFRGAKGKGFKDRILANRQMNAMQLLKKSAKKSNDENYETWKAFHGTTFRAYSLEIVKPQPTVKEVPKIILDEKPKTKWFRDPKTGYWVQVQKPTSMTWGVIGEFRKKLMFY